MKPSVKLFSFLEVDEKHGNFFCEGEDVEVKLMVKFEEQFKCDYKGLCEIALHQTGVGLTLNFIFKLFLQEAHICTFRKKNSDFRTLEVFDFVKIPKIL